MSLHASVKDILNLHSPKSKQMAGSRTIVRIWYFVYTCWRGGQICSGGFIYSKLIGSTKTWTISHTVSDWGRTKRERRGGNGVANYCTKGFHFQSVSSSFCSEGRTLLWGMFFCHSTPKTEDTAVFPILNLTCVDRASVFWHIFRTSSHVLQIID